MESRSRLCSAAIRLAMGVARIGARRPTRGLASRARFLSFRLHRRSSWLSGLRRFFTFGQNVRQRPADLDRVADSRRLLQAAGRGRFDLLYDLVGLDLKNHVAGLNFDSVLPEPLDDRGLQHGHSQAGHHYGVSQLQPLHVDSRNFTRLGNSACSGTLDTLYPIQNATSISFTAATIFSAVGGMCSSSAAL